MSAVSTGKPVADLLMVDGATATSDLQRSLLEARGYGSIESDPIHSAPHPLNNDQPRNRGRRVDGIL
jgi:hypothetical protein